MTSLTSLARLATRCGLVLPRRIVGQHVAVVLHRRAAARGVDDDGVETGPVDLPQPGLDVALGERRAPARCWPICCTEEPQQPEPATFTTSMPWRVSSRTVASLTSGASTCWPQPGISATRLRRSPAAGKVCGRSTGDGAAEPVRHRLDHRPQPAQEGGAAGIAARRRQQRRQRLGEPAQHHGPAEQAPAAASARPARRAGSGRAARACSVVSM